MIAQKKVLWRGYFRCAESFVLKRKGGGDLAKSGGDLAGPKKNLYKSASG